MKVGKLYNSHKKIVRCSEVRLRLVLSWCLVFGQIYGSGAYTGDACTKKECTQL